MKKTFILGSALMILFFLTSCSKSVPTQKEYVCPGGSVVSDLSLCPQKQKVSCTDGTQVDDYSECCVDFNFIEGSSSNRYCKDTIGTYSERSYCEGDYFISERYKCQFNRCVKQVSRDKCVEGATCAPYLDTVNCVSK